MVAHFEVNKKAFLQVIAVSLLALSTCFTFPENHFTTEKAFIKAPSPQLELTSLMCDDVEDSNDFSTGAHFDQVTDHFLVAFSFSNEETNTKSKDALNNPSRKVYLLHRQLLI